MLEFLPYYLFLLFMFALYPIMRNRTAVELANKQTKVQYLFLVMFALWILIGMRDVLYGRDTLGYVVHFLDTTSFMEDSVEPGYTLLEYLIRSITSNYHVFLMAAAVSTIIAMYQLMKRYFSSSYEIIAAICIYILLGLLAFNMAALRQSIALSLGIFAFMYADDGKWKQFLICVGIAYLFHNSAFVLLILYPLRYIDLKWYGLIIVAAFSLLGLLYPGLISPFVQMYLPFEDRFTQYGTSYESTQNYTGFILQLILILIAFFVGDRIPLNKQAKNMFFSASYIGLTLQSLTGSLAEMFRLSYYFCFFDMILIPVALKAYKGESAKMYRIIFIIGCLVYILFLAGGGVLPPKQDFSGLTIKSVIAPIR